MVLLTLLILIITILSIILWLIRHQYSYWKNHQIPYVEAHIPYGNLKGVGKIEHLMSRLKSFYDEYKNKSSLVGIYFFFKPVAVIIDQNLIKNILIKDANSFNDRGVFYNEKNDPISAHLFNIHGPKWKMLRTKLTPTFTSGKMKFMYPTIADIAKRLEMKLESVIGVKETIEIKDIFARYTTDVIGTCAFGIECNTLNDHNAEFRSKGLKIFDEPKFNFFQSIMLISFRDLALKLGIKHVHDDLATFFSKIIDETVNFRKTNNIRRNDFLDLLIELKNNTEMTDNPLTMDEITAQAFVFFAAGFETSSTLLTFTLYELSINQNIQEKARKHIEEIIEKHNGQLTYETMIDMKYLDQILNETLRLFPPLSMLTRTAEVDYKVPDSDFILKKGTLCVIPIFAIQRDEDIYPNANEFNPDNFNDENFKNRPSTTFLPFGEGPRNCIGARFGMMQARLGLIAALRKYKFSLSSETEHPVKISTIHFITSPVGGMFLKVQRL